MKKQSPNRLMKAQYQEIAESNSIPENAGIKDEEL